MIIIENLYSDFTFSVGTDFNHLLAGRYRFRFQVLAPGLLLENRTRLKGEGSLMVVCIRWQVRQGGDRASFAAAAHTSGRDIAWLSAPRDPA